MAARGENTLGHNLLIINFLSGCFAQNDAGIVWPLCHYFGVLKNQRVDIVAGEAV